MILDAQLVSRRATSLTIAGPPGLGDRLFAAMEVLFPGSSHIERQFSLDILELQPEKAQDVLGITVTPYLVKHPSGAPSFALRVEADNKVLCYSGDTEWVVVRQNVTRPEPICNQQHSQARKRTAQLELIRMSQRYIELRTESLIAWSFGERQRFDRVVEFFNPNEACRAQYLLPLQGDIRPSDVRRLVAESCDLSFAQLSEAYILAGQRAFEQNREIVTEDLQVALRVLRGSMTAVSEHSHKLGFNVHSGKGAARTLLNQSDAVAEGECR